MSILLDGTQGIDFNDGSNQSTAATPYARKNLIINGDMRIAQRGTSVSGITSGSGVKIIDRMFTNTINIGTWTHSQDSDIPTGQGFANSYKLSCTTSTSLNADSLLEIHQVFEGQNCQHLKKGTANAESLTLSFWVKTNKTGTYTTSLIDNDNTRHIGATYTVSSADTWEKKTITFSGDTSGALDNDNGASLRVIFHFAAGTNWTSGTADTTWGTLVDANRAVGQTVNLADSTSNYINITGVQLEVNDAASDFEFVPYDMELARCQRYYQRDFRYINGFCYTTTTAIVNIPLKVTMRSSPTLAYTSGASTITIDYIGGSQASSSNNIAAGGAYTSPYSVSLVLNGLSGRTIWQGVILSSDTFSLSSEL